MKSNYKKNKFEQLKGFCTVVECGNSINDAAIKNCISSTTISKQISSLEEDVGFTLFNRNKNRLILNEKGKIYYQEAKNILLNLDRIYGGKLKIKEVGKFKLFFKRNRVKFAEYKERNFNSLQKYVFMFIKIKYLIILITLMAFEFLYERQINQNFENQSINSVNRIINNIINTEKEMEKNQIKAMNLFRQFLKSKPEPKKEDLIKLSKKINVTSLSIWSYEGKLIQNTLDTKENADFWKTYKKIKNCQHEIDMRNHDGSIKIYPLKRCSGNCIVNGAQKCLTSFHKDIKKFLNVDIADEDVKNAIKNNLTSEIQVISLSHPNGVVIETSGEGIKPLKLKYYTENPILKNINNKLIITKPFNDMTSKINCNAFFYNKDIAEDPKDQYFYVLTAEFSKEEINKKIKYSRIIYLTLTSVILVVVYIINRKKVVAKVIIRE